MHYSKTLSLKKNHEQFDEDLDRFMHVVLAVVTLFYEEGNNTDDEHLIDWEDKYLLIEGTFLYLVASWDLLVEEDMIVLFSADTRRLCQTLDYDLPKTISKGEAEAILLSLRGYMDFRSVSDILDIARKCLVEPLRLFKFIPQHARNMIDQIYIIRNHIAHFSLRSRVAYERAVLQAHNLSRYRSPGRFLLAVPKGKRKPRLLEYIQSLDDASESIVENL